MTGAIEIVSALAAGRERDATALIFEYMASTQAEAGRPAPLAIAGLPPVLRRECHDLAAVYRPPGALLVAYRHGQAAGCVGLAPYSPEGTAKVRRLFVRPAHRGNGIARALMSRAHQHAAQGGITRLVLDVLPARTAVIGFYRRLGYTDAPPFATESPVPMVWLQRRVTHEDLQES